MIRQLSDAIAAKDSGNISKLERYGRTLQDKLQVLKRFDEQVLEQTEDDDVAKEIEQADPYQEKIDTVYHR